MIVNHGTSAIIYNNPPVWDEEWVYDGQLSITTMSRDFYQVADGNMCLYNLSNIASGGNLNITRSIWNVGNMEMSMLGSTVNNFTSRLVLTTHFAKNENSLYLTGYANPNLNIIYKYNITANTIVEFATIPAERTSDRDWMVFYNKYDGLVYAIGGRMSSGSTDNRCLGDIYAFDSNGTILPKSQKTVNLLSVCPHALMSSGIFLMGGVDKDGNQSTRTCFIPNNQGDCYEKPFNIPFASIYTGASSYTSVNEQNDDIYFSQLNSTSVFCCIPDKGVNIESPQLPVFSNVSRSIMLQCIVGQYLYVIYQEWTNDSDRKYYQFHIKLRD
jgi:hypothetical protein